MFSSTSHDDPYSKHDNSISRLTKAAAGVADNRDHNRSCIYFCVCVAACFVLQISLAGVFGACYHDYETGMRIKLHQICGWSIPCGSSVQIVPLSLSARDREKFINKLAITTTTHHNYDNNSNE